MFEANPTVVDRIARRAQSRPSRGKGRRLSVAAAIMSLAAGASGAAAAPGHVTGAPAPVTASDILVNDNHDLFLVRPDGTNRRRLTRVGDIGGASFSPDRSKIVLSRSYDSGYSDLFMMRSDGSDMTRLTYTHGVGEEQPRWSPDGSQIVLNRWSNADLPIEGIVVMAPRPGARPRNVFHENASVPGCSDPAYNSPVWSPTRMEIAVVANCFGDAGSTSVIVLTRPTGGITKVLRLSPTMSHGLTYDPAGDQLAAMSELGLFRINHATGKRTRVTTYGYASSPEWSPDGQWIAYSKYEDSSSSDVRAVRPDGSNDRLVLSSDSEWGAWPTDW